MNDVLDIVCAQRPERPTLDAATRNRLRARTTGQLDPDAPAAGEASSGSTRVRPVHAGHEDPIRLGEVRDRRSRGTRWLTVAAGMVILVGGVWWLRSTQIVPAERPAHAPPTVTAPDASPTTTPTTPPSTSAPGPGPYPLDDLDLLEAARRVSLAARIDPTPDEHADLAVAGEIMRRDCLRDGGATPPVLTSADHVAVRDRAISELRQRTRLYTTDGLESLRVEGFFPDSWITTGGSDSDPLWLAIVEGSPDAQLIAGGCGRIDDSLRAGPVEQDLNRLRATEIDGDTTGSRWADMALSPQDLPEFDDEFPALQQCMAEAGYPSFFDRGAEPNPFADFMAESGVTDTELEMANAYADCSIATDFPTTYVETAAAVLDEFDQAYQSELAALRVERDTALEQARTILTDNGIAPFTS